MAEVEQDSTEPQDLEQAVFQALGSASVCWDQDGVFMSERAKQVGDELVAWIKKHYTLIPDPPGDVILCPACGQYDAVAQHFIFSYDSGDWWQCRACGHRFQAKRHSAPVRGKVGELKPTTGQSAVPPYAHERFVEDPLDEYREAHPNVIRGDE